MSYHQPIIWPPRAERLAARARDASAAASHCSLMPVPAAADANPDHPLVRALLRTASPTVSSPVQRDAQPFGIANEARTGRGANPLPFADALPGTGAGGSIASVLQERMRQMANGHTPASDAQARDDHLPLMARRYAERAVEFIRKPELDAGRSRQRANMVMAAAFALAAIDRIDLLAAHERNLPDAT